MYLQFKKEGVGSLLYVIGLFQRCDDNQILVSSASSLPSPTRSCKFESLVLKLRTTFTKLLQPQCGCKEQAEEDQPGNVIKKLDTEGSSCRMVGSTFNTEFASVSQVKMTKASFIQKVVYSRLNWITSIFHGNWILSRAYFDLLEFTQMII